MQILKTTSFSKIIYSFLKIFSSVSKYGLTEIFPTSTSG